MIDRMKKLRNEEGFTLIELMIVMVVLGILAGIVIFAVGGFTEGADDKVLEANNKQCKTAQTAAEANPSVAFADYFDDGAPSVDLDGDGTEAVCTATSTE